jgi:hypothetical protein
MLLHQFDEREAEDRDEQEGECTEQDRPSARDEGPELAPSASQLNIGLLDRSI